MSDQEQSIETPNANSGISKVFSESLLAPVSQNTSDNGESDILKRSTEPLSDNSNDELEPRIVNSPEEYSNRRLYLADTYNTFTESRLPPIVESKTPPIQYHTSKKNINDESDMRHIALEIDVQSITDYQRNSAAITGTYMGQMSYYSITLDLVAVYLKGQKMMYIESKTFCEQRLYALMLPAIFVSALCTVLSVSLKQFQWGSVLVSGLTGFNSFVLSIITYLKLDAKSEAHKTSGYQFDKLQTICEFNSGKTLLVKDAKIKEKIENLLDDIEKKVSEIKDVNQFVIPEVIRDRYSNIYGSNVFAIVKQYKTKRVIDTQRLININRILSDGTYKEKKTIEKNNMDKIKSHPRNILNYDDEIDHGFDIYSATKDQLLFERDHIINNIIEYHKISLFINKALNNEIFAISERRSQKFCRLWDWLKT